MNTSTESAERLEEEVAALFGHDPRLVADPYPLYRRMREQAPVFRHGQQVLVTRHAEARELLTDPTVLQGLAARGSRYRDAEAKLREEQRVQMAEMFGFLEKRLGGTNGAHHMRLRKLAQRAFTPRMVALMEERIQAVLDGLIASTLGRAEIELIDDIAYHLPLIVISEMLDISTEDREDLRTWANDLGQFVGANWAEEDVIGTTHESVFNLRSYLTDLFARRRGGDTTSLLGALLDASADDAEGGFTEDELVAMVTQLIFAGHETSTNFIGNSMVLLLGEHRAQWDRIREDADLIPDAVEELLRFETPTQYIDKLASETMEVAGTTIHQWDTISVMLGAANRDPAVFDDPDRFDIRRKPTAHLTFGFGAHHCLGASLARLEARVVLRTFTERFPDMELVDDRVDWRRNHMLRGPEHLPIRFGPSPD